jgi:hypothetical protein
MNAAGISTLYAESILIMANGTSNYSSTSEDDTILGFNGQG